MPLFDRRPQPHMRNSFYRPPPPIGPSGMGIGHQGPEDDKHGRSRGRGHSVRPRTKSNKQHRSLRGRLFNMLRMNHRSSESDDGGGEKRDDNKERYGFTNLDWQPRKKHIVRE